VIGQFTLRHNSTAVVHEIRQHSEFVARQLHRHTVQRHFRHARVQRHWSTPQLGSGLTARSPDEGTQSRQKFLDPKWFSHIVVCAAVDTLNFFMPAFAGGQHEYRTEHARFAPSPQKRQTIDFGKSEIEHDRIVLFGLRQEVGSLAVRCAVYRVAGGIESGQELLPQIRLIFDYQYSQAILLLFVIAQMNLNGT
jgi:hypothetical protein